MPDTDTAPARTKQRHRHRRSGPPLGKEFRRFSATGLEIRNDADNDAIVITGMPIVYNTPYQVRDMFGTFEETMLPGVANDALTKGADVRFLFDHAGLPLARTLSGTLVLDTVSTRGLGMTASLDARQSLANDLAVAIERGDVNQMSCGFSVAADIWNGDETERSISKFADMFDVSAVTYPASPTTSIELAFRSIFARPIETQVRTRQLWVEIGRDFRDGNALSSATKEKLQTALEALHTADDVDVPGIVKDLQAMNDALDAGQEALADTLEVTNPDGDANDLQPALVRGSTPATADERRAAADSWYGDIEAAVSNALVAAYSDDTADSWFDLWIEDCKDGTVVFQCWEDKPGVGLWQVNYTIDADMAVTLTTDPLAVSVQTSYVPVTRSVDPELVALELEALQLEAEQTVLRGQRRHVA